MLWEILIASLAHRDAALHGLLDELARQIAPYRDVYVTVIRDDFDYGYGEKMAFLFTSATARYVSVIDDDDAVSPCYVSKIRDALLEDPDYVGFPMKWQVDGEDKGIIDISLRHGKGGVCPRLITPDLIVRDITAQNPMRREFAQRGDWHGGREGGHGADLWWADSVRELAVLDKEIYVPEQVYIYRYSTSDHFVLGGREPTGAGSSPLPAYPWLDVFDAEDVL